ncbi:MAG: prepilin-type N-terminal cleavage/methylation domain-containing protein [Elusimicrobia bacterium]|nr:prepilin-type N-terminal cleavage/methylation domain-containing protein [Elusimicrobiota bacterium]
MKSARSLPGFTIMEVLIVVIVAGIIAAFTVPTFTKAVNNARARNGIRDLEFLHGAQKAYRVRNGAFYSSSGFDTQAINENLGINLSSPEVSCNPNQCFAKGTGFNARVTLGDPLGTGNPCCTGTSCPGDMSACGS